MEIDKNDKINLNWDISETDIESLFKLLIKYKIILKIKFEKFLLMIKFTIKLIGIENISH